MFTTTAAALILLAMTSGAIAALTLAMGHVWLHHRPGRRGAHRRPTRTRRLAETLIWSEHPAQLPLDPDATDRIRDVDTGPTAVLRIGVDPWRDREDADSLLALAA